MNKYTIIIEKTDTGYSAYVPDLPGCITVGDTVEQTRAYIKEAIELYLEQLRMDGKEIPKPTTISEIVTV
jgi:predicted RNase H-like HicB family nuclease